MNKCPKFDAWKKSIWMNADTENMETYFLSYTFLIANSVNHPDTEIGRFSWSSKKLRRNQSKLTHFFARSADSAAHLIRKNKKWIEYVQNYFAYGHYTA